MTSICDGITPALSRAGDGSEAIGMPSPEMAQRRGLRAIEERGWRFLDAWRRGVASLSWRWMVRKNAGRPMAARRSAHSATYGIGLAFGLNTALARHLGRFCANPNAILP
jgi:hypothetical protein